MAMKIVSVSPMAIGTISPAPQNSQSSAKPKCLLPPRKVAYVILMAGCTFSLGGNRGKCVKTPRPPTKQAENLLIIFFFSKTTRVRETDDDLPSVGRL